MQLFKAHAGIMSACHCPCSKHMLASGAVVNASCRAAKLILKAYDDLRAKRSSKHSAALAVKSSQEALKAKWRTVQHLYNKQLEAAAGAKGKAVATAPPEPGDALSSGLVLLVSMIAAAAEAISSESLLATAQPCIRLLTA